jgi:hypothetical protein
MVGVIVRMIAVAVIVHYPDSSWTSRARTASFPAVSPKHLGTKHN